MTGDDLYSHLILLLQSKGLAAGRVTLRLPVQKKNNRQNRSFHYCAINVQTQGELCQHNIDSKIK